MIFLILINCRHHIKQVSLIFMTHLFRIVALTLLALSVSMLPLRGLARANAMDCCLHMGGAQNQNFATDSAVDPYSEPGCPHQDSCQSSNCMTASSCSTFAPGLTASSHLSFKPVTLISYDLVDSLYSSQSTTPLLKPPCILSS